jgi:hypothetical protein
MSPEQITALTTLISMIEKVSGWPFGMVLMLIIVGPWILSLVLAQQYRQGLGEIRQMYKNNVHLVEGYESVCKDLKDVVVLNAQTCTQLADAIRTNQFCPQVRLKKHAEGVVD